MESVQLDIRGQICPSCLLLTLRAANQHAAALRSGATEVVVLTDDRMSVTTIPDALARMGLLAEVEPEEKGYRIRVFGAATGQRGPT